MCVLQQGQVLLLFSNHISIQIRQQYILQLVKQFATFYKKIEQSFGSFSVPQKYFLLFF
jgi:hypothetical protein